MKRADKTFNKDIKKITAIIAILVAMAAGMIFTVSCTRNSDTQETTAIEQTEIATEVEKIATESVIETTEEEPVIETEESKIDLEIEFDDVDPDHFKDADELESMMKQVAEKTKM